MKVSWAVPIIASILILGTLGNAYALNLVYLGNNIAQTGDIIAGKMLTGVREPHIADNGDVIFIGDFSGGPGIFLIPGDGISPPSLLAKRGVAIGGAPVSAISDLSISDNGDIVFVGTDGEITTIFTETGVIASGSSGLFGAIFFLDEEINSFLILLTVGSPSINNNGDVLFVGNIGPGFFNNALLLVPGDNTLPSLLVETPVVIDSVTLETFGPLSMNNDGDVAFYGLVAGPALAAVFSIPFEGSLSVIAKEGNVLDGYTLSLIGFNPFDDRLSINDNDEVVFVARSIDPHDLAAGEPLSFAIFNQNQLLVKQQIQIDGETPFHFRDVIINNNGDLLFLAQVGFSTDDGIFTPTNLIAVVGDRIDSLTLSDVDAPSMNNNGDVVFVGTGSGTGIYLASLPDTGTLECGAGTTLNVSTNECEADLQPSQCAAGTTLNVSTNECEADLQPSQCAAGTTLNVSTNECEADLQPSQCAAGTTLNVSTNECEADVTQADLDLLQNIIDSLNALIAELEEALLGPGNNEYSPEQCTKFQEIAEAQAAKGKDPGPALRSQLVACGLL